MVRSVEGHAESGVNLVSETIRETMIRRERGCKSAQSRRASVI